MDKLQDDKIYNYLEQVYGKGAKFRDGQLEAIKAVLSGKRALVVQKTGWGKSLIYFLSAKILRDMDKGLCIIISPLLALMNNQIDSASKFGLTTVTINSNNTDDWDIIVKDILNNQVDVLFISPERLANQDFMNKVINNINHNIGMFVVDEAHCISDWGHDFRPDYKRIANIIKFMPSNVPLLATTATANDRVIEDIRSQLGQDIFVLRGELTRESLYIQIIHLNSKEERLAWLLQHINQLDGTGIIYCLTKSDCNIVSSWLIAHQINAYPYTGKMEPEERKKLENKFNNNEMKVLVATVAFGMGIDKPDIGFVIHFQKPGNVVAYYQQIGRAGRNIDEAYAVLLAGDEDDEVTTYFIKSAFPTFKEMDEVIKFLSQNSGVRENELITKVNISKGRLEKVLKFLLINADIYKEGPEYYKAAKKWEPDFNYSDEITKTRFKELEQMNIFINSKDCLMKFIASALNDVHAHDCIHCANCLPKRKVDEIVSQKMIIEALEYLKRDCYIITPRKQWPPSIKINGKSTISSCETYQAGYALSNYGDAGWGRIVSRNKYVDNYFSEELIEVSYNFLKNKCKEWDIKWITSIPSLRRPDLVKNFASALANKLNIPYCDSINKLHNSVEQKTLNNSYRQYKNAYDSFEIDKVQSGNVLLVDDMVDSKWTLTICANKLINRGSGKVYPFALANTASS